jgi:hypothetical protein
MGKYVALVASSGGGGGGAGGCVVVVTKRSGGHGQSGCVPSGFGAHVTAVLDFASAPPTSAPPPITKAIADTSPATASLNRMFTMASEAGG